MKTFNMMSENTIYLDIELRKLRPAELYILSQILNISDSWKKLMAIIPKDDMPNLPKFNSEHFRYNILFCVINIYIIICN